MEKDTIFPAQEIDTSFMITNHNHLYEDKKHKIAGTTFSHRKMMVRPSMTAQIHTMGGQVNYINKPTGK